MPGLSYEKLELKNGAAQAGTRCCGLPGRLRGAGQVDHQQHSLVFTDCGLIQLVDGARFIVSEGVIGLPSALRCPGAVTSACVFQPRAGRSSFLCFPIKLSKVH